MQRDGPMFKSRGMEETGEGKEKAEDMLPKGVWSRVELNVGRYLPAL